jgi:hypothetical protein
MRGHERRWLGRAAEDDGRLGAARGLPGPRYANTAIGGIGLAPVGRSRLAGYPSQTTRAYDADHEISGVGGGCGTNRGASRKGVLRLVRNIPRVGQGRGTYGAAAVQGWIRADQGWTRLVDRRANMDQQRGAGGLLPPAVRWTTLGVAVALLAGAFYLMAVRGEALLLDLSTLTQRLLCL